MAVQRRSINGYRIARGDLFVIPLDADDVLVPGNWHEACISKSFGSGELNATVSAISLLGDGNELPVKVLRVTGQTVSVALPVGNDGAQSWTIPIDDFRNIALVVEEQRDVV